MVYFVLPAMLTFPPVQLFFLTLVESLLSALIIYKWAGSWNLYKFFAQKHQQHVEKISGFIQKKQFFIIFLWSLIPIIPTDIIPYVCGIMKTDMRRMMLGLICGEVCYYALLIFAGKSLLSLISG